MPATGAVLIEAPSLVEAALTGHRGFAEEQQPILDTVEDRAVASVTLQVIQSMERKLGGVAHLVLHDRLRAWSPETGYAGEGERPTRGEASVLTPPSSLDVIRRGYDLQIG